MAIEVDQCHGIKPLSNSLRCRLQSCTHLGFSHMTGGAANIKKSFSRPCLSRTTKLEDNSFGSNPQIQIVGCSRVPRVHALVVEVASAMASGADLLPVPNGLGGAYFLCSSSGDNIAVAKPIDEEPFAFNNPKGFGGRMLGKPGLKRSVRIGESGFRELAAYLLDHGSFAGVPPTALVNISHVAFHVNNYYAAAVSAAPFKISSLQRFVNHDFDAGELGFSGFSIASVHQIGIFDIRVLNLDRHAGNMLVKKHEQNNYTMGVAELVPIDHGFCLPEWLDNPYFEWLHWPQASVPFSESEIDYISNLDPCKDAEILRTQIPCLREASVRVLVLCTIFLKRATTVGLCLADIGEMMTRQFCDGEERFSALENLCLKIKYTMSVTDDKKRETTELGEVFEFLNESKDSFDNLPRLVQICPRMPRFSSVGLMTDAYVDSHSCPNNDHNIKGNNDYVDGSTRHGDKIVNHINCETEVISFGEMSNSEWDLFLEKFEKLLIDILFKGTHCISSLRTKLNTSCRF